MIETSVQPISSADLEVNLSNMKPISFQAQASSVIPGLPADMSLVPEQAEGEPAEVEETEPTEVEETEESSDEQERPSNAFTEEFKQHFGIEPAEAVELFNGLQAFRDELTLMREWGVSPTEYDSRMASVKEFYQSLPEEGREQFNSINGAVAIWNHLQTNGQAPTRKTTVKPGAAKAKPATTKQKFINKSDILRMSKEEYRRMLPEITKAFAEGRVREDA